MNRLAILVGVSAALVLGTVEASAQAGIWLPPACKLNTKHFLVNSAQLYLKNATQAKTPDQRATNLRDAGRVLNQAVTEGGQSDNPAVWYFMGRYYLLTEDMQGADTAFGRAVRGQPDCKDDIDTQRRNAWVPEIQAAADALNKNDMETAKVHFRKANAIYQDDPIGFYYLANVFTNEGKLDSGIHYYRRTIDVVQPVMDAAKQPPPADNKKKKNEPEVMAGPDSSTIETYETSVFNLARLYHQSQKWDSATIWYEKYRQIKPGDMQAISGLAAVYGESGDSAKSQALYAEILQNADAMPVLDLFSTGISLFRDEKYQQAAQAFQGVLKRSPYYRDALYNLASTYLSMGSVRDTSIPQAQRDSISKSIGEKMVPVTRRMVEIDPYNRNSLRMLAMGYQFSGMQDSVLSALTRAEELPFEVNVTMFQEVENGHQVKGTVTALPSSVLKMMQDSVSKDSTRLADLEKNLASGRDPKTNRPLAPAIKQALEQQRPVLQQRLQKSRGEIQQMRNVSIPPLTFEFLDQAGQVVASQTVPPMTVQVDESKEFELTAVGAGITGWRYKAGA